MPSTSSFNNKYHRTHDGKPSEGVMKKAQAGLDAQRQSDAPYSVSPNSPERFGKLRQRTDDTIFKNESQMDDSNYNDITRNHNAGMQQVSGTAKKPNTWKYNNQRANEAEQMKNFQQGGEFAPQSFQQRRGRIYNEDSEIKGARDEFDYERRQQQRFAAQQRERHRQQEMRSRAEDAADGFNSGMRWGEGMSEGDRRYNNMDRNEGGYLSRKVPQELESSVRKNPFAAPRNEAAAKQRSANSSPFQSQPRYMYGTDYPQGNVRYYENDDDDEDFEEKDYEDDEEDAEYNENRRFWDYEARSPFQQQQQNLEQEKREHPGNLYGGHGIMTAAEGEIDSDLYQDDDAEDSDEAPFSSSAFDSLDYEYLRYINEREAIRERLNQAREQRRLALSNQNNNRNTQYLSGYEEDDDMMENDDENENRDRDDDEELADLDARVNYLLYLRSLQARGDPDAEGLLREYYHAHYGSEAYERARERFMNRIGDDEDGILDGIDDDDLLNDEDDEAIIDEVLERSQLSNPYPNLVPYHWSSAAPKRMREEYAYEEEDFFEDDDDDDDYENEADLYDDDYEDDGDYYIRNEERQGPSIYNTYGGVLGMQSNKPQMYKDPSEGWNNDSSDIYKDKRQDFKNRQADQSPSASAAAKGAFAAASAARVAQQVGKPKEANDFDTKNKKQWSKDTANQNRRVYTVPESVQKYQPSDAEVMMLFFGVLPFSEDISLGTMPRDRKARNARKPRGSIEGTRNFKPPSPLHTAAGGDAAQNHFMYSNAPAPTMVPTPKHDEGRDFGIAALPFSMDDDNGAMPHDKKFGDGQMILMEQARKEKMKRDIERGYDPDTRTYKGPSRKDYGKKNNNRNSAAIAPAPVNTETVNRMEKVFATLFADSDDEGKMDTKQAETTKLTVVTDTNDIAKADRKALDESKRSEGMRSLTKSQNSAFRSASGTENIKKDINEDSAVGPAPIIITADHPRNDMAESSGKNKIHNNDNNMSAEGTPLITPPRVLNTEGILDQHNVSDSTRFDSGFVAPANSLISDPNIASNGKSRNQMGVLDAPRNGSVNHLDGKNYEGAHLSSDAERKKEGDSQKVGDDKPMPGYASSIAPPSYIVGPSIAKEAKEEAGAINDNDKNHNDIKEERVAAGAPIVIDRPTAATANANAGVTEGHNAVPIVHESDKNAPKPHLSPAAPQSDMPKQQEKISAVPPSGRPTSNNVNGTSVEISSAPTVAPSNIPVHPAAARPHNASKKNTAAQKNSWNCCAAPTATKDEIRPATRANEKSKKVEEKKK